MKTIHLQSSFVNTYILGGISFIDFIFLCTIQFSLSIKSLLGLDFMNEKWNIKKPQISSSVTGNYSVRERDQSYQDTKLSILKHEALLFAHKSID